MIKILSCLLDNRFGGPQKRSYSVAEELKKYNIETVFLFNERVKGDIPIKGFKCFLLKNMQCIHIKSQFMGLIFFCLNPVEADAEKILKGIDMELDLEPVAELPGFFY